MEALTELFYAAIATLGNVAKHVDSWPEFVAIIIIVYAALKTTEHIRTRR